MAKKWYLSKTLHAATLAFVAAVLRIYGYEELAEVTIALAVALGLYGLRTAKTELI